MPGSNPAAVEPARRGRKRAVASPAQPDADGTAGNGFATAPDNHSVVSLAELTRRASAYLPPEELARIREAYRFGDQAHLGQFRSSGAPYISHPIAVAEILARWKLDADTLMAALLHDVIEDTSVAKPILIERFGPHVAELVDGLSKLERVEFASKEQQQAESFRKMLLAMARDVRVILVKLADRLHNMQTLDAVPREKQQRIARETLEIYAPIASRLGAARAVPRARRPFLRFLHRGVTRRCRRRCSRARQPPRGDRPHLETVQKTLPEAGVNAQVYAARSRSTRSTARCARRRSCHSRRCSISTVSVCSSTPCAVLPHAGRAARHLQADTGRFKDYIAIPKINGYQSLHTTWSALRHDGGIPDPHARDAARRAAATLRTGCTKP